MDKIVLQYEADVSKLSADLNRLESSLKRTETSATKAGAATTQAYEKPIGTINKLKANLETLIKWRDAAFSPGAIEAYNAKIRQTQNEINKLTKGTQNMGGSMKQVTSGALSGLTGGLAAMGAAGAAAFAVGKIVSFTKEASRLAAETEGVGRAFDRLNQPNLLNQLRKATKGTVSDLELMKAAVNANNFQIPLKNLGDYLAFANQRAIDTGQSVDYLVNSIVVGIARKSPLILDNLGINIKRVREEFKKTGDFAQAAANIIKEEMKNSGDETTTTAQKTQALSAAWDNVTAAFGKFVNAGAVAMPGVIGFIQSWADKLNTIATALTDDRAQKQSFPGLFVLGRDQAEAKLAGKSYEELAKELAKLEEAEMKAVAAGEKMKNQSSLFGGMFDKVENKKRISELRGEIDGVFKLMDAEAKRIKQERDNQAKLGTNSIALLKQDLQITQNILETATIGSKDFYDAQARVKVIEEELAKATGKETAAIKKLSEEYKKAARNIEQLKIALMPEGPIKEKQQLELKAKQDIEALVGTAEQKAIATKLILAQLENDIKEVNDKSRVEKINTNRLPTTIPETNFAAQAQQEKENTEKTEAEKWEIRRFWSNKALDMAQTIEDAIYEITRRRIEAENELLDSQHEADMKRLEDQRDRRTITEAAYNKQRKKFDEDYYAKQKELRIKAAKAEKADNIFKIIINTARAIVEAMPDVPLSIIAGVTGAIQLGVAASQPIPQFKKGTLAVKGGVPGKDSVPAILMPGEAVIPTDKAVKYNSHLEAMMNGNYDEYLTHKILMPYIRRHEEALRKGSTAEQIASSLKLQNVNNFDDLNIVTGLNRLNSKLETTNKLLSRDGGREFGRTR